jgi:hypothetical protein
MLGNHLAFDLHMALVYIKKEKRPNGEKNISAMGVSSKWVSFLQYNAVNPVLIGQKNGSVIINWDQKWSPLTGLHYRLNL